MLVEPVGESQVEVAESGAAVVVITVLGQAFQYPVGICYAPAGNECGLSRFIQRAFEMEAAGEHAYAGRALQALRAAPFAFYAQDRRQAAAILRRNRTLKQLHILHDVRIKGGKEPEQVAGIIDCTAVEQHQVLVLRAAPDIEPAGGFANGFHTGKHKDGLDDIPFSEGRRDFYQRTYVHNFVTHRGIAVVGHALCRYYGSGQEVDSVRKFHIQRAVGAQVHIQRDVFFPFEREIEDVLAGRERY